MTCYACHTSWMTSCSGCHLPQEQNVSSADAALRGDGHAQLRVVQPAGHPHRRVHARRERHDQGQQASRRCARRARSCISSTNAQRQRIYIQQPPISAPGYSSQAFNPHVPHTVRSRETQGCGSCHVTEAERQQRLDGAAAPAGHELRQLHRPLRLGRGRTRGLRGGRGDGVGRAAGGDRLARCTRSSIPTTTRSTRSASKELASRAPPSRGRRAQHPAARRVRCSSRTGEGASRSTTSPTSTTRTSPSASSARRSRRSASARSSRRSSPRAVALPTTMPMDPTRKTQFIPENQEQPIHPLYRYAYIADREEGLILVDVTTLTDGDPANNFLARALTFNPDGALHGAERHRRRRHAGSHRRRDAAWSSSTSTSRSQPRIVATARRDRASRPAIAVQFRYAFVTDAKGLQTIDITDPAQAASGRDACRSQTRATSTSPAPTPTSPAAKQGVVIVDVERPEKPFIDQVFDTSDLARRQRRQGRLHQRQRLRLRRRRRARPRSPAAHLARVDARATPASARGPRRG